VLISGRAACPFLHLIAASRALVLSEKRPAASAFRASDITPGKLAPDKPAVLAGRLWQWNRKAYRNPTSPSWWRCDGCYPTRETKIRQSRPSIWSAAI